MKLFGVYYTISDIGGLGADGFTVTFIGCKFTNTDIDTTNPGVHFKDCEFKTVPYK